LSENIFAKVVFILMFFLPWFWKT